MQIDMRVMELLASKICHDLVSPVSAINNGVELIEDIGGSVVDEAMKLIGDSGTTASRRLRLFRMAYGRAGSEENVKVQDVRQIAEQYLSGGKITLEWPEGLPSPELATHRGFMKTLLNLVILAEESLAYGGSIALRAAEDGRGCKIEISGRSAHLNQAHADALEGVTPIEELSPRTIQSYVVGRFVVQFGFKLTHDQSVPDRLVLDLSLAEAETEVEGETVVPLASVAAQS